MTSKKTHRVGLVGAGYISPFHVAALRRLPGVEVVGIHDLDQAKAEALASRFALAVRPSLASLREAGAEVIHVLTPPATHAAVTTEALQLGCHALVEKPLATEVEDCERIETLARQRGLTVGVCHSLLYDPQVRRALEAVRRGELGRLVSVDILRSSEYAPYSGGPLPPQYRTAGYPFRDLGIHALYLFEAFLGPIEDVKASWSQLGGDPNLTFDEWRALVRCRDGLGQFQLSWNVRPLQSQIILQGTKGVRRVDLFLMFQAQRSTTPLPKPAERIVNGLTDSLRPLLEIPLSAANFARGKIRQFHGVQDLVAAFYQALDEGRPAPVTPAQAASAIRWTEHVARAAEQDVVVAPQARRRSQKIPYLVTGASGALGGALLERLRAEGKKVRIFVRRRTAPVAEGVEVVVGDLGDPEAVDRAVEGAQVVFHVGAAMKGGWPDHERATIVGTRNVLASCARHGVNKLIHVSSLSVIDWAGGASFSAVSEETPLEPRADERGVYTRAKLEAERLVVAAAKENKLPAVIVRPGQIFGGRIPLMTPAVARRVGKRWLALGDGKVPLPLVYIDDVVDALLLAANSDLRNAEIIQIVDPAGLTQNDVLARVVNGHAPILHIPRGVVFGIGRLSELALGAVGRKSPLSEYRLRSALAQRHFDGSKAKQLIGWEPRVGVEEGIRRLVAHGTGAG